MDIKTVNLLLQNAIILIDTREKAYNHITNYLNRKNIKYKKTKLDFGDYSIVIPSNGLLNYDINLSNIITIERKANLNELSINLTKDRKRIENEFERKTGKMILLVEDNYSNLVKGRYLSRMSTHAFNASLMTFANRYNIELVFIQNKDDSAVFIRKNKNTRDFSDEMNCSK